ncbi:MAG: proline--tRNA ligase [Clostridiaceae bacterium]|nr:proline--tRNA ligase [Clostridiaceae bacterium]
MSKNEKMVQAITSRSEDFTRWYTDICLRSELCSYSSVRGCIILRPYGYAIWELITGELDRRFKDTGHQNVMMPLFIPESMLQKEKDHVEGFAPEVAWVTHGGEEPLTERLCVRPTSETLFCDHYAEIIESWRDLPKLYNQWVSVVRWEKTTRPFLRTREFFWQEGHTAHATKEEAVKETLDMLDLYAEFYENALAIPVLRGLKSESEKFAGAVNTYTVEAMMHDGKALQAGTTHYLGDGFAKAFNIQFTDKDNELRHVHQTSWGISSRSIGGLIMVHGDDDGLVLPPAVAPYQVVVIPVAQHKEGVLPAAQALADSLKEAGYRVLLDDSDRMPGWKFSEHEMKGVPVRLEIGPRDIQEGRCVAVTRDNRQKTDIPLDQILDQLPPILQGLHDRILDKARKSLESRIYPLDSWEAFVDTMANKPGFILAAWGGSEDCEAKVKEETTASSRCLAKQELDGHEVCVVCGQKAKHMVYWGKAY